MLTTETLIIAAGVKGAKKIGDQYQPYLTFNKLSNIQRVVQSAINASAVGNIVIWGNKEKLSFLLGELIDSQTKRILIVEEKGNFIDSFIYSYLISFHNKEINQLISEFKSIDTLDWDNIVAIVKEKYKATCVNLILSDTPFITHYEIDNFIKGKDRDADIVLGRSDGERMRELLESHLVGFDTNLAVKNYYKYIQGGREVDLIVNSFFAGNPINIDIELWSLLKSFYKNRTIISGNKLNFIKVKNNIKACKKVFFKGAKKQKIRSLYFLFRSYYHIVKHRKTSKFSDIDLIRKHIFLLTGMKVNYMIDDNIGSALDVDTEYEKIFFEQNLKDIEYYIHSFRG